MITNTDNAIWTTTVKTRQIPHFCKDVSIKIDFNRGIKKIKFLKISHRIT